MDESEEPSGEDKDNGRGNGGNNQIVLDSD